MRFTFTVFLVTVVGASCSSEMQRGGREITSVQKPITETPVLALPERGALLKAVIAGDRALVESLVASGAAVNENLGVSGNDLTPLLAAIAQSDFEMAGFLIDKGASVHVSYGGYRCSELAAGIFGEEHPLTKRLRDPS